MPDRKSLIRQVRSAFATELSLQPKLSLRAGDAIDEYRVPPPYEEDIDSPTGAYLEKYCCGLGYLDPDSWRHYLPQMMEHVCENAAPTGGGDALFASLRPPDREPPRLASLSAEQERAVVAFLDFFAFSDGSPYVDEACVALEEWWAPGALYRR